MTHDELFLRDIAAHPDDDTPRLIYADWLDEHAQPERAEFIRLQCELARMSEDDPRREKFKAREQDLLSRHGADFLGELSDIELRGWEFRRGLLEWVFVTDRVFLAHADDLFRHPLRDLRLELADMRLPEVARSPYLTRLRSLNTDDHCVGGARDAGAKALAESPHLAGLTSLNLGINEIGDAGARALAVSPFLASLTFLDLGGNQIGDEGVQALATSPYLTHLSFLGLDSNERIGDVGAQALADSPNLVGLKWLNLSINRIGDVGALALAASAYLRRITRLSLYDNFIGEVGRQALHERFGDGVRL